MLQVCTITGIDSAINKTCCSGIILLSNTRGVTKRPKIVNVETKELIHERDRHGDDNNVAAVVSKNSHWINSFQNQIRDKWNFI